MITFDDFQKIDVRVGKIIKAEEIPNAKHSTHKLVIDFGKDIGIKTSCARAINYTINELTNRLVLCVINLPPRQIGKNISEVLTLGVPDDTNECRFLTVDPEVPLGGKLY